MPETTQSDLVERLEAMSDTDGEYGHHARSQLLAQAAAEITRLQATIQKVQRSALTLTEAQRQIYDHYQAASKINKEAVVTLDSERAANAMLTEENDRLRAHCEALAKGLTTAGRQISAAFGIIHPGDKGLLEGSLESIRQPLAAYRKEGGA